MFLSGNGAAQNNTYNMAFSLAGGISIPVAGKSFSNNYLLGYHVASAVSFNLNEYWNLRPGFRFDTFAQKNTTDVSSGYLNELFLKFDLVYSEKLKKKKLNPYGFLGLGL